MNDARLNRINEIVKANYEEAVDVMSGNEAYLYGSLDEALVSYKINAIDTVAEEFPGDQDALETACYAFLDQIKANA